MLLLLEHRSNSPSLKAGQDDGDSLFCKAMRGQVRLRLGPQGFSLPGSGAVGQQRQSIAGHGGNGTRSQGWTGRSRVLGLWG